MKRIFDFDRAEMEGFMQGVPEIRALPIVNTGEHLSVVYYQRNTPDSLRNWGSYRDWEKANEEHLKLQGKRTVKTELTLPKEVSPLYHKHRRLVNGGILTEDDRICLEASWSVANPETVYFGWIERNKSGDLKGMGAVYLEEFLSLASQRGFNFAMIIPRNQSVEEYWRTKGFKSIEDFSQEEQKIMKEGKFKLAKLARKI